MALETETFIDGGGPSLDKTGEQDPSAAVNAEILTEATLVNEVKRKYDLWRQMRRPYEVQWYVNASALRGFPDVRFNAELNRLEIKREPAHRRKERINLIKPKYIARLSKFTKVPTSPEIIPATTDREDIMNARASQVALEYASYKLNLKRKYRQLMCWVPVTGKAFLWLRWDDEAVGTQVMEGGENQPIMGDVSADFGSAFEFLPADPGIELLEDQPEIMRVKMVEVRDVEEKYPELEGQIHGESTEADIFFYQRQIADLGTRQQGMASKATQQMEDKPSFVMRIELFTKPCGKYPFGRYVVVASNKLLRYQDSLPGGFQNIHSNPYPVVEFRDDPSPGQFWPDAFVERVVGIQSEYNEYRSKIRENLSLHFFPHLFTPSQANLSPEAYTNEGGQIIDYTWIPGIPPPFFLQPTGVLGDAWNIMQAIKKELDEVTMISPPVLGNTSGTNSGYQVNLLQEAADTAHYPAIEQNAEALTEVFIKIRHLMKIGYTEPRLVSAIGKNNIPEVHQFKTDSIDEMAEVRIELSDMLPVLRSARIDMLRQMFVDGVWGKPDDPKARKMVQRLLKTGYAEFEYDREQRDEEQAQLENVKMSGGELVGKPMSWENHEIHYDAHTDLFKSPEAQLWTPEQWRANAWHVITHATYINPQQALMMAAEFGLENELFQIQQLQQQAGMMGQVMGAPPPGQLFSGPQQAGNNMSNAPNQASNVPPPGELFS